MKQSGKPYIKPSGQPTFKFTNNAGTIINVYETSVAVEVFQESNNHTQRQVMTPMDFDNFYSLLVSNGFVLQK